MTPKARVLASYPGAYSALYEYPATHWTIEFRPSLLPFTLGTGRTAREAWANAAAKLEKKQ